MSQIKQILNIGNHSISSDTIDSLFYLLCTHKICTIVPELKLSNREKGRKKTKQETSTQYKVTDPISMVDLENIHTRKGRYPSRPLPQSSKTWEEVRRENEERMLKAKMERALKTPLETTSTHAMDTEEVQEISREIAEKVAERELRKQKYAQYQKLKQMSDYKVPRADPIPVTD